MSIIPFFNSQLEALGVEYIDYYLMHCQMSHNFQHFKSLIKYFGFDKLAEMALQHEMESKSNNIYYVYVSYKEDK
mgnify:CR=1 FL=1